MEQHSLISHEALEKAPVDLKNRMARYLSTDPALGRIDRTRVALARAVKAGDEASVTFILEDMDSAALRDLILSVPAPGLGLALSLAAESGHRRIVKRLIDAGTSIAKADEPGRSLKEPIILGNVQIVKIALENGKFSQKEIDDLMKIAQATKRIAQERAQAPKKWKNLGTR